MRIRIVKAGKPAFAETRALCGEYERRLKPLVRCESVELKSDPDESFAEKIGAGGGVLVVLDERGAQWSSEELAGRIATWQDDPRVKEVVFLIGSPYGVPSQVRKRADALWSLSRATFPSDLAWVLCWEQVYRAYQILKGTGYHHG